MRPVRPSPAVATLPVTFTVGSHAVIVQSLGGRWSVSVDGAPSDATFGTQADAWEAGVREADRVDRLVVR